MGARSFASCVIAICLSFSTALADKATAPESLFIGPDSMSEKPFVVDSIGATQTMVRALAVSGIKSNPSRWKIDLGFHVHFKQAATDDVVMIQVLKGKKKLGKPVLCSPNRIDKDSGLLFFSCPKSREDPSFSTKGKHSVKLTYRRTLAGKDYVDFASFEVDVEKLMKGAANNPAVSWSENHDSKLPVSTITEVVQAGGPLGSDRGAIASARRSALAYMTISTWFKREVRMERTKMTCTFDGKVVAEGGPSGGENLTSWSFRKKGSTKKRRQAWSFANYQLYTLHPRPAPDGSKGSFSKPHHFMNENPGAYKCVITGDGEIIKELSFSVGPNGEIVKPVCQSKSMNTLRSVTLIAAKDKKLSTVAYDKKAGSKRGFDGRVKWANGCPPR